MWKTETVPLQGDKAWSKDMGPSINYVSMVEGGGGSKMLTDAYVGEGGGSEMLM